MLQLSFDFNGETGQLTFNMPEVSKDSNVDKLSFEIINPLGKESWADEFGDEKAVKLYINGESLDDIILEKEKVFCADDPGLAFGYGHPTPRDMVFELEYRIESNSVNHMELYYCESCGIGGCWSVIADVIHDNKYFYWTRLHHNHEKWDYNLSYKFDKKEYLALIEEIRAYID